MKCANCGRELNDAQLFCPNCGTKNERQEGKRTCPFCGGDLKEDARFCPKCGKELKEDKAGDKFVQLESGAPKMEASAKIGSGNWTDSIILRSYVGKNEDYYSREFKKIQNGKKPKFNWAAFFFGPILSLYRKNYTLFLKLYLIPMIILMIGVPMFMAHQAVGLLEGNIGNLFWIPVAFICVLIFVICICAKGGGRFNRSYYQRIQELAKKNMFEDADIKKKCGVSWLFVIVFIILSCMASLIVNRVTFSMLLNKMSETTEDYSISWDEEDWTGINEGSEITEYSTSDEIQGEELSGTDELTVGEEYSGAFPIESIINTAWSCHLDDMTESNMEITQNEDGSIHLTLEATSIHHPYVNSFSGDSVEITDIEDTGLYIRFASDGTDQNDTGDDVIIVWTSTEAIGFPIVDGEDANITYLYDGTYIYSGAIGASQEAYELSDINPYSDSILLWKSYYQPITEADCQGLTSEQLRIARNEIYAAYGRIFTSQDLIDYFNSKEWYQGTVSPDTFNDSVLTEIQKQNVRIIQSFEEDGAGYR